MSVRKTVALIGGGPACMIAAYFLGDHFETHLYEQGKSIGRKFLVAGNGGFNLTNSATNQELLNAYSPEPILHHAISVFDSQATRQWLSEIGIPTFIGSSSRVFPEAGIKPVKVLNQIKKALITKGVQIHTNATFVGFNEQQIPLIKTTAGTTTIKADSYFFGLGGGSWKKTGSNTEWLTYFNEIGINTLDFESSNCGVDVDFDDQFFEKFEGTPLKNIAFSIDGKVQKGEAVITKTGLEGNAIYPLIPVIRKTIEAKQIAPITIDLKPNNSVKELLKKVDQLNLKPKNYKYTFRLNTVALQLLKNSLSKAEYLNPIHVAKTLKSVPISIRKLRPIEEAISTVGGIPFSEINNDFSLKKHPRIKVIGEMLNWDSPTGGYLLQGCFSTGYQAAITCIQTND